MLKPVNSEILSEETKLDKDGDEIKVIKYKNGVTDCISKKFIVRVHPGKLTEEEIRKKMEAASKDFYKAIMRSQAQQRRKEEADKATLQSIMLV